MDIALLVIVILVAFSIRLGFAYWPNFGLFWIIFGSPIIAIPIFIRFGLYRAITRFIGFKAIWSIMQAVTLYSLLWGVVGFMAAVEGIPRSVLVIQWLLAIMAIGGSRMFASWLFLTVSNNNINLNSKNVVIYGAGSAGRQLSNALMQSTEYKQVAFVDDKSDIHKQTINGIEVISQNSLEYLISQKNIKEVLLAIPSLSRARRIAIINFLEQFPVVVRSLPGVAELAQGKVKLNDLLEIDLTDLLGRDLAIPDQSLLKTNITNKVVLVTGAGGSIGSELCRQIVLLKPKCLVLFDVSEAALYEINQELLNKKINLKVSPVIGSVLDRQWVENICKYYGVQTIYHTAAYKHVPLVECNQSQGVLNNTIGTMHAAEAAISSNVETFVLISTDKAVRPTNIMGASKRAAELVLQAFSELPIKTCFTMVRFGNVLDSSGSVIPLFKKQIEAGGPVTVTHRDVVRYFMTIPEAVELVIQAGAMSNGGDVFLLDMGEPVLIFDLAKKMIQLSGLELLDENNPNGDIAIEYTGLRPGEKLYEELLVGGAFNITSNKHIMRAKEEMISWKILKPLIADIESASRLADTKKVYTLLQKIIPEFTSTNKKFSANVK